MAGDILLTVKAARRSASATKARVSAKTNPAPRVRQPIASISPETIMAHATPHANGDASGGMYIGCLQSPPRSGGWNPWSPIARVGVDESTRHEAENEERDEDADQREPDDRHGLVHPLTETEEGIHFTSLARLRRGGLGRRRLR